MMRNRFLRMALPATLLAIAAFAADITGTWEFTVETAQGSGTPSFEFKQEGEKLTGTYSGMFGKAPISGTVKGDAVEFTFEVPNLDGKVHYKGTLDGPTRMKGDCDYGGVGTGTFTAKKK
jgi:hypothetical protein